MRAPLAIALSGCLACACASTSSPTTIAPEPVVEPRPPAAPQAEVQARVASEATAPTDIGSAVDDDLPPSCEDTSRVRRAVGLALERARSEGLAAALIADCDPGGASFCGARAEAPDVTREPPSRCVVQVWIDVGAYAVHVTPTARQGAPVEVEVWVDARARETGFARIAATTWAVSADGAVLVRGLPRTTSHTHGGDPAQIGGASYRITHRGARALPIRLVRVAWIDTGRVSEVGPGILDVSTVPPQTSTEVEVSFPSQPAYAALHERFATTAVFDVGGRALSATVEHHVVRREPLRTRGAEGP